MMQKVVTGLLLWSVLTVPLALAQVASPPQIIGHLVGPNVPKAQPDLAFWGTDLGGLITTPPSRQ